MWRQAAQQPHYQAAQRRTQPERDARAAEPLLDRGHPAHDRDCHEAGGNTEDERNRIGVVRNDRRECHDQRRRSLVQHTRNDGTGERRDDNVRQCPNRISADDQLYAVEGAAERCAERAGDRRRRPAADHQAEIGAAQPEGVRAPCRKEAEFRTRSSTGLEAVATAAPGVNGMQTKPRKKRKRADHSGSSLDSFLEQEGIREEVEAVANKRVLDWQLERSPKEAAPSKRT